MNKYDLVDEYPAHIPMGLPLPQPCAGSHTYEDQDRCIYCNDRKPYDGCND